MNTRAETPERRAVPLSQASSKGRILVLDNEDSIQRLLRVILEGEGYDVQVSDDGHQALRMIEEQGFDLIIQDLRMPKMDGMTFLRILKERQPKVICVVLTAFGTWETAVEAMRLGAYTHLSKPFDTEEIRNLVGRAMERRHLLGERPDMESLPFMDLVGNAAVMNAVATMIRRIAPTDSTVLISGESGTGKELAAQTIHFQSLRASGPFVPVNCGAFTETLLESELFGHVKGAFTNAINDRKGFFETANGGTLFLDEVGEMSLPMQVKFLRVLETRCYKPVGSSKDQRADVRFIAATNRKLAEMVAEGNFREDLYHRLNVIPIAMPALRERKEDIPLLTGRFLARYSKRMRKTVTTIDEAAANLLLAYAWPGNVRELENTIERAVALSTRDSITSEDIIGPMAAQGPKGQLTPAQLAAGSVAFLPPAKAPAPESLPLSPVPGAEQVLPPRGLDLERHLLELERSYILQALERTDWNLTESAKLLGMTFRSIRYRISKLNIERPGK